MLYHLIGVLLILGVEFTFLWCIYICAWLYCIPLLVEGPHLPIIWAAISIESGCGYNPSKPKESSCLLCVQWMYTFHSSNYKRADDYEETGLPITIMFLLFFIHSIAIKVEQGTPITLWKNGWMDFYEIFSIGQLWHKEQSGTYEGCCIYPLEFRI